MAGTHTITGHWEFTERAPLPAPVRRFVAVGLPYVVATFGTPAHNEAPALYDAVIAATAAVGMRLFVHIPPHLKSRYRSDDRVFVSSEAFDFRLLYAGATAVLHHGGMGTLHSVTAQGVPSVIVPRGVDQFFWAKRALDAQLTASVLPRRKLTSARLTAALQPIILQPEYRFAARQLALQMAEEPAFARAARVLAAYLA
jgi:sterol 3beta-glucosyltransferase